MPDRPIPDEFTETRQQFGRRAITTSEAAKALFVDLLGGYTTLNNFTNPIGRAPTPTPGPAPTGTNTNAEDIEQRKPHEGHDGHHPYLVHDIIKAIDALIEFTAEKYL